MKNKIVSGALAILALWAVDVKAIISVTTVFTNGLSEPYSVVMDSANNLYISDSGNNRILKINASTQAPANLAGIRTDPPGSNDGPPYRAHFNNPQGLLVVNLGGTNGLLVTDSGNHLLRFVRLSDGTVSTLAGQLDGGPPVDGVGTNTTFLYPAGMDQDGQGHVFIADWGNNRIRIFNLNTFGVTNLTVAGVSFNRPTAVRYAGTNQAGAGQLWISDTGNQTVKLVTLNAGNPTLGTLTTYLGGEQTTGTNDSLFGPSALFNGPSGLLWYEGIGLLVCDSLNNTLRLATNFTDFGETNYAVTTFAGVPSEGNGAIVDGDAETARFHSPYSLTPDPLNNGFLVADLKNNAIRRIQTGPPLPPVPTPAIGWVDFPPPDYLSVLRTDQPFVFNNDVIIMILAAAGTETHYTYAPTPTNPLIDTVPNPSADNGSTPPFYFDGMTSSQVPPSILAPQPDLTIKAIGVQSGRQNSSIASARFQFLTAAPSILGDNAANFVVKDVTIGAEMWYTLDGSDPTNGPPSLGPINNGDILSINAKSNITFKVRAFREHFANSSVATKTFAASNFVGNVISFGFASGEASSDFIASPGQIFYAPVVLKILKGTAMYSLQFNLSVTNDGPKPGPAVLAGAFGFESFLEKPDPADPKIFERIPPLMYYPYADNPPPAWAVTTYDFKDFVKLSFTNAAENLMGVGWLERLTRTNLFDTTKQDLIKYSQPHDTLFDEDNGKIVVGGYWFQVPTTARPGDTYRIQIGRPSATSDGVGAPGSAVLIESPTDGSLTGGGLNSIKIVTAQQRKYLVGDSAPFRWFNAGDFGNSTLDNSDVMQVFQSAIYGYDSPPLGSDFFDAMDSCCTTFVDLGMGYLEPDVTLAGPNQLNVLFDGNNTNINQIAFGDGNLDVTDLYVTFRRSLDPGLVNFRRFWTNGVRAAEFADAGVTPRALLRLATTNPPSIVFGSQDVIASPGQTLQIPLSAQIFGDYPLRVLMIKATIRPLDGSPALTTPVQFTPNPLLGDPTFSSSLGNGDYAGSWLDNNWPGLTGEVILGTLTVQIPADAPITAAYAIRFEHASGSPNGLASFPNQIKTGLITMTDRSSSSLGDAIPDSWRLRYFGSTQNLLSQADADADGDGQNNWQEYVLGTDPLNVKSCFRLSARMPQASVGLIHWPSVVGKQYIIERTPDIFVPNWIPVATNIGTGNDLSFGDSNPGDHQFYRVRVVP